MPVECSNCKNHVCRLGRFDSPTEDCPMHGEFPSFEELYETNEQRERAYHAAVVEAEGYCEWTRLREVVEYAQRIGVTRLGLGHCSDMGREVNLTAGFLRKHGFDAVLPPKRDTCAPVYQAEFFSQNDTELNIVVGMHVGHEAMFVAASEAPVVVLVARDARLRHNPVAALYTSGSYSRARLFDGRENAQWSENYGPGLQDLERAADQVAVADDVDSDLNRVQETMAFAQALGARHVGLSFCDGFRQEARLLSGVLTGNGFQVSSVCCKTGGVPKEDLGLSESQKVHPGEPEMICNPLAQAELLNRDRVQFGIILGQCVGHEAATLGHLEVPAICLVAKDRVLAHNTVAALYELES